MTGRGFLLATWSLFAPLAVAAIAQPAAPHSRDALTALQREAHTAFDEGRYDRVIHSLEAIRLDHEPSRELLRIGILSYLRVGRSVDALRTYTRFVPPGRPEDSRLLRELALGFITERVHDPQEYVRIAVYTALAANASEDVRLVLEDGLHDPSVLVRAQVLEGLGRLGRATSLAVFTRALQDPTPTVRIAALMSSRNASSRPSLTIAASANT